MRTRLPNVLGDLGPFGGGLCVCTGRWAGLNPMTGHTRYERKARPNSAKISLRDIYQALLYGMARPV